MKTAFFWFSIDTRVAPPLLVDDITLISPKNPTNRRKCQNLGNFDQLSPTANDYEQNPEQKNASLSRKASSKMNPDMNPYGMIILLTHLLLIPHIRITYFINRHILNK